MAKNENPRCRQWWHVKGIYGPNQKKVVMKCSYIWMNLPYNNIELWVNSKNIYFALKSLWICIYIYSSVRVCVWRCRGNSCTIGTHHVYVVLVLVYCTQRYWHVKLCNFLFILITPDNVPWFWSERYRFLLYLYALKIYQQTLYIHVCLYIRYVRM